LTSVEKVSDNSVESYMEIGSIEFIREHLSCRV